jgi:hypothetical protein
MSQAEAFNITRRNVLAAVSAAPVAVFPTAVEIPLGHKDATLLHLGRELIESWKTERALDEKWGYQESPEIEREFEQAANRSDDLVRRIEAAAASTFDGLRIKAMALLWCHGGDAECPDFMFGQLGHPVMDFTTDYRIAASILRDLVR